MSASADRPVYMSCVFFNGVLGLATYQEDVEEVIKGFQGWDDDKGPAAYQILRLAMLHARPTSILVSQNAPRDLIAALNEMAVPGLPPAEICFEKNSLFKADSALELVRSLNIAEMPSGVSDSDRLHWINSRIDLGSTQMIRAVGALVHVLLRDMEEVHIQTISEMRLEGYLKIDENSLRGLQIFQEDAHPSIVEIGGSKEGFSLFGLMDRCVTLPVNR